MTIAEMRERSKEGLKRAPGDLLLVGVLLLTATASFGLGILVGKGMVEETGFSIEQAPAGATGGEVRGAEVAAPAAAAAALQKGTLAPAPSSLPSAGNFVASKNGKRYYLPTCSGVKQIKETNKVWFLTKEDAEAAGYTPALNCPGL